MEPGPLFNGAGLVVGALGLYVCNNAPSAWYNSLAGGALIVCGAATWISNEARWVWTTRKAMAEVELANTLAGGDTQKREARQIQRAKSSEPPIYSEGRPVNMAAAEQYNQTVQQERLQRVDDRERYVARTLVEQESFNGKMNIAESFWIRDGHWQGSAEEFRAMRLKWEAYKIVAKRNDASNARYEVVNGEAVGLIATGRLKLPPPPA
jgi:hypothetical protein